MTYVKTRPARIVIALILSLALIFTMTPLLPTGQANAVGGPTVLTIEFKVGATGTPYKTIEYDQTDLDGKKVSELSGKYLL
jgi:hypothetical protein